MNDTVKLLKECNSGCKMAINSMDQINEYVENPHLEKIIHDYKEKHENLEKETAELLEKEGAGEKEPGAMASMFSWMTTKMKMAMESDSHEVAKIMMNGCNMGIQSICECENQCENASQESLQMARKLVKLEEDFMGEMKQFL